MCSDNITITNSANIIKILTNWFNILGFPKIIRSDGGPQFRSEFDVFCNDNNIKHELLSPYNPSSNGLAEQAVKTAKHLLINCSSEKYNFQEALQMWRCFPQKNCFSPAEMFFGRRQRSCLLTLQLHHPPILLSQATSRQAHFCQLMRVAHDKRANDLPSLAINQRVLVQHHDCKLWSIRGVIHSIRSDEMSFVIQLPSGQHITRGRRLIRSDHSTPEATSPTLPDTSSPPSNQKFPPPTSNKPQPSQQPTPVTPRPKRVIKKPSRFLD